MSSPKFGGTRQKPDEPGTGRKKGSIHPSAQGFTREHSVKGEERVPGHFLWKDGLFQVVGEPG